jgi:hypothetical protein
MKTIFIYHFWNDGHFFNAIDCQHSPIIYSIASLRACGCNSIIKVIENTPKATNWGSYPKDLDFEVIPKIGLMQSKKNCFFAFNHFLSQKIGDVLDLSKNYDEIVYCDSDIIWIKNPLPLNTSNKLHITDWCSGFYHFKTSSIQAISFLKSWDYHLIKAALDFNFQCEIINEIKDRSYYKVVNDESAMIYNLKLFGLYATDQNKVFHFNGTYMQSGYSGIHIMSSFTDKKKNFCEDIFEINEVLKRVLKIKEPSYLFNDFKNWSKTNSKSLQNFLVLKKYIPKFNWL